jgi:hypothetical protein
MISNPNIHNGAYLPESEIALLQSYGIENVVSIDECPFYDGEAAG